MRDGMCTGILWQGELYYGFVLFLPQRGVLGVYCTCYTSYRSLSNWTYSVGSLSVLEKLLGPYGLQRTSRMWPIVGLWLDSIGLQRLYRLPRPEYRRQYPSIRVA